MIKRILLWAGVTGVCALPALSNVGYFPNKIEYILPALIAFAAAAVCAYMARLRYLGGLILLLLTVFSTTLYFGNILFESSGLIIITAATAGAFAIFSFLHPNRALLLASSAAYAQIIVSAAMTPSFTLSLQESSVTRSDLPSVIHVVLDEHAGMAAIPSRSVSADKVQEFTDAYVKQGFTVFTHAYTADKLTQRSLVRMFNTTASPKWSQLAQRKTNPTSYKVLYADNFDAIAQERAIDITQMTWIDFSLALRNNTALARNHLYNVYTARNALDAFPMSLPDRLVLAKKLAIDWLRIGVHSPMVDSNVTGRTNITALSSRYMLQQLTDRLACCGERGTYYFAHVLLPHFDYVFDESCHVRPIREWRGNAPRGSNGRAELSDRIKLYRLHFAQATCAAHDILAMVASLARNSKLADSVILIHSDHGSRIAIRDYEKSKPPGYDRATFERDYRGSFLAIKIPGMEGGVIDTPVRLDAFYNNLLANRFQKFDLDAIEQSEDSPY